jgi:hypothetical protein
MFGLLYFAIFPAMLAYVGYFNRNEIVLYLTSSGAALFSLLAIFHYKYPLKIPTNQLIKIFIAPFGVVALMYFVNNFKAAKKEVLKVEVTSIQKNHRSSGLKYGLANDNVRVWLQEKDIKTEPKPKVGDCLLLTIESKLISEDPLYATPCKAATK